MTAIVIIDAALHVSSVPATYVAPGLLQAFGVSGTQGSTTGTLSATAPISAFSGDTYTITPGNIVQGPDADVIAGHFSGAGSAVVIPVGFAPTMIKIIDWTNDIVWEWMPGAPAAADSMKITTATAVDTGSAILVTADAAGGAGDVNYITLSATLAAASAALSFRIEA